MKSGITGIILAGGQGRRMGMEKGLVSLGGKPMITFPLKVLSELCDEILISANTADYDYLGHPVIPDLVSNAGPMAGIWSCLLHSKNEINLVAGCDMPFLTNDLYRQILDNRASSLISVPGYGQGRYEPMCGYYHRSVIPAMKKFMETGNLKLPDFFAMVPFRMFPSEEFTGPVNEKTFFSVNSPDDLIRAEIWLKEAEGEIQPLSSSIFPA
jgi:molybdopterin-guanine dinucleotide biosynthesis protein A